MKKFEEKAIKDMSEVVGGAVDIYLTVKIENLFDGIKGNTTLTPDAKITIGKLAGPGEGEVGNMGDIVQANDPGAVIS